MAKKQLQNPQTLGQRLRYARERQGYTREQIVARTDIGDRHLAAIEVDKRKPSVDSLFRLVRALGISADELIYPEKPLEQGEPLHRLMRMLEQCDERDLALVQALVEQMINEPKLEK